MTTINKYVSPRHLRANKKVRQISKCKAIHIELKTNSLFVEMNEMHSFWYYGIVGIEKRRKSHTIFKCFQ